MITQTKIDFNNRVSRIFEGLNLCKIIEMVEQLVFPRVKYLNTINRVATALQVSERFEESLGVTSTYFSVIAKSTQQPY